MVLACVFVWGFFRYQNNKERERGGEVLRRRERGGFLLFRKYLVVGLPLFVRLRRAWVGCWR